MTGPTVANAGPARKPELRSVCTETLYPALLLVAGSSPWHAGGLLSWGPVRSTRGAELNHHSGGCKPCIVITFPSVVALGVSCQRCADLTTGVRAWPRGRLAAGPDCRC